MQVKGKGIHRGATIVVAALLFLRPPATSPAEPSLNSLIEAIQKTIARMAGQVSDKDARALFKDAEKALATAGKKTRGGKNPSAARADLEQAHKLLRAALFSAATQSRNLKQDIEEALARLAPVLSVAGGYPASLRTADGLHEARFQTPEGVVLVRLPGDMGAGDTISGTVENYGSGPDPSEKNRNVTLLGESYRIGVETGVFPSKQDRSDAYPSPPAANGNPAIALVLKNRSGAPVARVTVPVADRHSATPQKNCSIPGFAAAGKPIVITGPFDGRLDTTRLTVNGETPHELTDIPGVTEDVTGVILNLKQIRVRFNRSFYPVAESPRALLLISDAGQSGKCQLKISEGNLESACLAHLLGIELTADKMALLKGETTLVHLIVRGLLDIRGPVDIHLENFSNTIKLEGGNSQDFTIAPRDAPLSGEISFTRTATGISAGDWSMSATLGEAATRLIQCSESAGKPAAPAGGQPAASLKTPPLEPPVSRPEAPVKPAGTEPGKKPSVADPEKSLIPAPKSTSPPAGSLRLPEIPVIGKTAGAKPEDRPVHAPLETRAGSEAVAGEPRADPPLPAIRKPHESPKGALALMSASDLDMTSRIQRRLISSVLLPLAALGFFFFINQLIGIGKAAKIDLGDIRRKPHLQK